MHSITGTQLVTVCNSIIVCFRCLNILEYYHCTVYCSSCTLYIEGGGLYGIREVMIWSRRLRVACIRVYGCVSKVSQCRRRLAKAWNHKCLSTSMCVQVKLGGVWCKVCWVRSAVCTGGTLSKGVHRRG